eukprot:5203604-Amphidinium_carterae.1
MAGLHDPEYAALDDEYDEELERDSDQPWQPTTEEMQALKHLHDNLGHPTRAKLCRMLRHAGCKPQVVKWVSDSFTCETCQRHKRPQHRIPAKHPATFATNQIVGIDLVFVEWAVIIVHILDWGSGYQMADILPNKNPETVFRFFLKEW